MSSQSYRSALVGVNVLLVLGIAGMAIRTYTGSSPGKGEMVPENFDPVRYALDEAQTNKGNQLQKRAVIWAQLDRPRERRTVIPTAIKRAPVRPQPQDLSRLFSLVMANYNDQAPKKSTVILQDRNQNKQITVAVGQKFSGYEVLDISISGDGDSRMASVTIKHLQARHTIQLKRKPSQ